MSLVAAVAMATVAALKAGGEIYAGKQRNNLQELDYQNKKKASEEAARIELQEVEAIQGQIMADAAGRGVYGGSIAALNSQTFQTYVRDQNAREATMAAQRKMLDMNKRGNTIGSLFGAGAELAGGIAGAAGLYGAGAAVLAEEKALQARSKQYATH